MVASTPDGVTAKTDQGTFHSPEDVSAAGAGEVIGSRRHAPLNSSASGGALEPLVASVKDTARMLGVGRSTVFELLASNELERVKIGRITRVTIASIRRLARA